MCEVFRKSFLIAGIFIIGILCGRYLLPSTGKGDSSISSRLESVERRQQLIIKEQRKLLERITKTERLSSELESSIRNSRETVSGIEESVNTLQGGLSDTDKILRRDKRILEKYIK